MIAFDLPLWLMSRVVHLFPRTAQRITHLFVGLYVNMSLGEVTDDEDN